MTNFTPILRFVALSDVHYEDEPSVERERMAKALRTANRIADESPVYKGFDALCVVGDFANKGSQAQFAAFKHTLDEGLRPGTRRILSVASHEFMGGGPEPAYEKLRRFFGQAPDVHEVIHGYHFISLSPSRGTSFNQDKRDWAAAQLALAAADDPRRPIFFFQHPHVTGTVYGSIIWGEDELCPILMNYPQVIDFSGHSHAPVNDPRSIHQQYFTSLGCGTLSYFENDEFDKYYGTCPPAPEGHRAAQMLIVEADAAGRVRVIPYDILTDQPFPCLWDIPAAWSRTASPIPTRSAAPPPCRRISPRAHRCASKTIFSHSIRPPPGGTTSTTTACACAGCATAYWRGRSPCGLIIMSSPCRKPSPCPWKTSTQGRHMTSRSPRAASGKTKAKIL